MLIKLDVSLFVWEMHVEHFNVFLRWFGMNCDKYFCGNCKEEVREDDNTILCKGACQLWFHANYQAIDDCEYELLLTSNDKLECAKCGKS